MNAFDNTHVDPASFSFNEAQGKDKWFDNWTVVRTGFTDVGTPVVTARYKFVGRQCFFQVKIVPATSIATVAGTSYILTPVPALGLAGDGSMQDLTAFTGVGALVVDPTVTPSRIYLPAQVASAHVFLLAGWFER